MAYGRSRLIRLIPAAIVTTSDLMEYSTSNTATSESNNTLWSLVYVTGADFMDTQQVPHGVAEVTYFSQSLSRFPPNAHLHPSRV